MRHSAVDVPLPGSFGVRLDPGTIQQRSLLMGGTPFRIVRLAPLHADVLARWQAGETVGAGRAYGRFARALVAANLAQPVPPAPEATPRISVIVPVRDRPHELDELLRAVRKHEATDPVGEVVVVDDASADQRSHEQVAKSWGARYLRRSKPGGSAAARNDGATAAAGDVLAFVDSDCVPRAGWLSALTPHFADPLVAAVAPRIVAHDAAGSWLARYEAARSSLDRGPVAARVIPGGRVPFVPAAALAVRAESFGDGFDSTLRGGEDVDLVWRLTAAGMHVRYEPGGMVAHRHRTSLRAFLSRRAYYGRTAAPIARRHPGAARPLAVSPWTAAAWAAAALRSPASAVGIAAAASALLARRFQGEVERPIREAIRLAAGGTARSGEVVADACVRAWWPLSAVAFAAMPRLRPALSAAALLPGLLEWRRERPDLDVFRWLLARRLDDAAYGWGLWCGSIRERFADPLKPDLSWRLEALTSDDLVEHYCGRTLG